MSSIELWPKQQEVYNFVCDKRAAAILSEPRTGKTFVTLKLVKKRIEEKDAEQGDFVGLLVCLLNNKQSTWLKYLGMYVPEVQVFFDLDQFKKAKGHRMLVVHFEQVDKYIGKLVKYKKLNWACVDEAHRLYNPGSRQSRAMARLHWVEWKLILTGTPMEKKPTDFFGQFKFLDPSVFGTNKSKFEEKWLDWKKLDFDYEGGPKPGGAAWKQKIMQQRILKNKAKFREKLLPEFVELLKPYCIRIEKTDVNILPPVIKTVPVAMTNRARTLYDAMKKDQVIEVDGEEIMASMPATRVMKLRQLASGFIYDEEGGLHWISTSKLRKAIELFEEMPKPVVIFASFVAEVKYLHRQLEESGYDVSLVYGGTPKKKRPAIWDAFQSAQLDAVICQTGSGGTGVDLWKANRGIVTSMSYSSITWDQAKSRMDVVNKPTAAEIYVLNSERTIDVDLFDLIELKGQTTKSVLRHLKGKHNGKRKDLEPARSRAGNLQHPHPGRRTRKKPR